MTHRSFVVWLVLALVTLTGAVISVLSQPGFEQARVHDEVVFPTLHADPNAVAKIAYASGQTSFTLQRQDDGGWQVAEKSGYPAAAEKIRELVVALADTRFVEAKTSLPESFARLEVEEPGAEAAKSRRITLSAADGAVLADLVLGKRSTRRTGRESFGTYLRRPDSQQAWLVNQEIPADRKIEDWLDREILNIAQGEIAMMEITPAAGEGYSITRDQPEGDFVLEEAPEDKTLDQGAVKRIASALYFLNLKDVEARDGFQMPEETSVARLTTYDGLGVLIEVASVEDRHWAFFTVGYTGDPDAESDEAKAAQARADDLNAKVGPWVFEISNFEADRLRQPLTELFKKDDGTS